MARAWTHEQRLAIDTRNKSLLVSAAAGSGKTATLTQRIIESILDEKDPADISKMLIVTFTRAAVGELRERISTAIKERLEGNPENTRLEKQLLLLPSAKILTIDAFCNDCLKNFPDAAGISPRYRIADEAEILLISREIFDGLTESILRGELQDEVSAEDFENLTDCLADSRQMADVFDIFRTAYEKLRNTKDGINTFARLSEEYNPENFSSPNETVFGKYIYSREREEFIFRAELFSSLKRELEEAYSDVGNYAELADSEAKSFTRVANSANYTEMRDAVNALTFENLKCSSKTEKSKAMLSFARARSKEKDLIKKEKEKFFIFSDESWRNSFEAIYPLLNTFLCVLRLFDAALIEKKKKLSTFDYTDIERLAFSALVKNGKPTEIAESIKAQYRYVYIDEYQDVNDLQDSIFRAVSNEDNRFAVGDIKQSIYGFRSANPKIFAEAKRSYPEIQNTTASSSASLFMSKNFRSSEGIISFVNSVFDTMFDIFADGIDYTEKDRLEVGRAALGDSFYAQPSVFVSLQKKSELDSSDSEKENPESQEASDSEEDNDPLPPAAIAAKIKELLKEGKREDGTSVKPSDIAVILRSLKNKSELYTDALKNERIPVKTAGKKNFFINADVLLALCLLNSINNPLRDVYLTGLLRSPLFDFSANELVEIRGSDKYKPFYYDLIEYTETHPDFYKGKAFLSKLNVWREAREGVRTDRFLAKLFRETGLLALASEHGEKENLIRLYQYARTFEDSSFGGLGSFITYINNVIAENGKFDCNISSPNDDAVTIISVHSSKGLEFPIVFYADAGKKISNQDIKDKFLFLSDFGAATRHRTPLGLAVVNNPMINAIQERMKEENLEEELRILYVALTRAKEKLFVVGSTKLSSLDEYKEKISSLSKLLNGRAAARRLSSHLDIILSSSGAMPSDIKDLAFRDVEKSISEPQQLDAGNDLLEKSEELSESLEETETLFLSRFKYKYHSPQMTSLPEKLSVSSLYPTVLDGTEEHSRDIYSEISNDKKTVPEFISLDKREESKRRGIATHLFLQFCDLQNLQKNGVQNELERLEKQAFISKDDAPRVRISEIEAFVSSKLFKRMLSAKRLFREFRFNTPLPAALFTNEKGKSEAYKGKNILIQGVIDCVIESDDGSISVIDYKTDRLTKEELENLKAAEERLRNSYENQLYYYTLAAERIFGKKPSSAEIFSLHLGETVDVMKKDV